MRAIEHTCPDFLLWLAHSSRTFAGMRVQIVAELEADVSCVSSADSRAVPSFLAVMNGDDSLFQIFQHKVWQPASASQEETNGFAGSFILGFRGEELSQNRALHFSLLEKLAELLRAAGSTDALEVRLGLTREATDSTRLRLALQLTAMGNSAAQAEMRWALGLVHVQQALLFTSRYFRQQFSARND